MAGSDEAIVNSAAGDETLAAIAGYLERISGEDRERLRGELTARGCTTWRWVPVADLPRYEFPAANRPLFEVDNRGASVFVTLAWPHDIPEKFAVHFDGQIFPDFSREVVFVAIKNGRHNGIGYFIDTGSRAAPGAEPIPLTELWDRMVSAF